MQILAQPVAVYVIPIVPGVPGEYDGQGVEFGVLIGIGVMLQSISVGRRLVDQGQFDAVWYIDAVVVDQEGQQVADKILILLRGSKRIAQLAKGHCQVIRAFGQGLGPLALADLDGDGTLDLFVGGRLVAGRYPEAADSHLYLNKVGRLVPDEAANALLAKAVRRSADGAATIEAFESCCGAPIG